MAPNLHRLFKREAAQKVEEVEYEEEEEPATTLATKIFGKHLHKVRVSTPTTTTEGEEGKWHLAALWAMTAKFYLFFLFLNVNKTHSSRGGYNHIGADAFDGAESAGDRTQCGRHNRREDRHSAMGCRFHFCTHLTHHSRHMWLLHSTVLPQATLQRRQEGHERRRYEIGTVTWIRL